MYFPMGVYSDCHFPQCNRLIIHALFRLCPRWGRRQHLCSRRGFIIPAGRAASLRWRVTVMRMEHKHLHEECLLLFSSKRLYTTAFLCPPSPLPLVHGGTSLLSTVLTPLWWIIPRRPIVMIISVSLIWPCTVGRGLRISSISLHIKSTKNRKRAAVAKICQMKMWFKLLPTASHYLVVHVDSCRCVLIYNVMCKYVYTPWEATKVWYTRRKRT